MYKCKYFQIKELVSPVVYSERGERAWQLLDKRLLVTIDRLRDKFGPMIINNWSWGWHRKYSGLRLPGDEYYSKYSQHSFGRAADCLFENTTVELVRRDIISDPHSFMSKYIKGIEMDVPWLHIDVRNVSEPIKFYPGS